MIHFEFKGKVKSCMPLSEHSLLTWACVEQDLCKVLSHRKGSTQRIKHQQSCLLQSNLLSGRLAFFLLSSPLEDQWKTCLIPQKGTKISVKEALKDWVYCHSFSCQVGRIQLCSTMHSPAVLLKLLLLSYFVEKAEGYQFFITGPP